MSHVEEPGICYCDCHRPGSMMMHCAPCCQGPCPVCKKNYMLSSHVEACKKRITDLMNEVDDT